MSTTQDQTNQPNSPLTDFLIEKGFSSGIALELAAVLTQGLTKAQGLHDPRFTIKESPAQTFSDYLTLFDLNPDNYDVTADDSISPSVAGECVEFCSGGWYYAFVFDSQGMLDTFVKQKERG